MQSYLHTGDALSYGGEDLWKEKMSISFGEEALLAAVFVDGLQELGERLALHFFLDDLLDAAELLVHRTGAVTIVRTVITGLEAFREEHFLVERIEKIVKVKFVDWAGEDVAALNAAPGFHNARLGELPQHFVGDGLLHVFPFRDFPRRKLSAPVQSPHYTDRVICLSRDEHCLRPPVILYFLRSV